MKKSYASPELTVHGTVEEITRGNATGQRLDQPYVDGTPGDELTFTGGTEGDFDPEA